MIYDLEDSDDDENDDDKATTTKKYIHVVDSQRNSLFLDDEAIRRNKSSSSFHEFIPGHNTPLRERMRRSKQTDYKANTNSSLAQRASKMIKAKYHGTRGDTSKDSCDLQQSEASHDNKNNENSNGSKNNNKDNKENTSCLLYTSPSPRDRG